MMKTKNSKSELYRVHARDPNLKSQFGLAVAGELCNGGNTGILAHLTGLKLPQGNYQVEILGKLSRYGATVSTVEAFCGPGAVPLDYTFISYADERGVIGNLLFSIAGSGHDLELKIIASHGSEISLEAIVISAVADLATARGENHVATSPKPENIATRAFNHIKTAYFKSNSRQLEPVFSAPADEDLVPAPWVIITGVVRRDIELFLARLNFWADLKKEGVIGNVVFSTWAGEIDKNPSVKEIIMAADFIVAESYPPILVGRGHYLHQIVCLESALRFCPKNSFVLKTRTDLCGPEQGFHDAVVKKFLSERNYKKKSGLKAFGFSHKIGIYWSHTKASLSMPVIFFWHDCLFFGKREDLQKLINYNVEHIDFFNLIPEQLLYAGSFFGYNNLLKSFFKAANQSGTIDKMYFFINDYKDALEALTEDLIRIKLFRRTFLFERYLINQGFFEIYPAVDFKLHTHYRGRDISKLEGVDGALTPEVISQWMVDDYEDDIDRLSKLIERKLDVHNYTQVDQAPNIDLRINLVRPYRYTTRTPA